MFNLPNRYQLLDSAEHHLQSGKPLNYRYAALELRMFMETVIYQKAESFKKYVPENQYRTWQASKLLDILVSFDELADKNFSVSFAPEAPSGEPIGPFSKLGDHATFSLKWLRKHYNKVGAVLHFPRKKGTWLSNEVTLEEYLAEVLKECRQVVKGNILGASLGLYFSFDCMKCGQVIVAPTGIAKNEKPIECLNDSCSATYWATPEDDGTWTVKRNWEKLPCKNENCDALIGIERADLIPGRKFTCDECGQSYLLILGYQKEEASS